MADGAGRRRGDLLAVLGIALASRLAIVAWAWSRIPLVEDGHYYDVLARRLAAGLGYTWLWPDGAVTYAAHYPVGYPALVAVAYRVLAAAAAVRARRAAPPWRWLVAAGILAGVATLVRPQSVLLAPVLGALAVV